MKKLREVLAMMKALKESRVDMGDVFEFLSQSVPMIEAAIFELETDLSVSDVEIAAGDS